MPNIKSAKKRVRVTETKTLQNKMFKTQMKTDVKVPRCGCCQRYGCRTGALQGRVQEDRCCRCQRASSTRTAPHTRKSEFTKALNAMQA